MSSVQDSKSRPAFLEVSLQRAKTVAASSPAWLHALRQGAHERLAAMEVPTTANEEWRFTRLRALNDVAFGQQATAGALSAARLEGLTYAASAPATLVFVNGQYRAELSRVDGAVEGVKLGSLRTLAESDSAVREVVCKHLGALRWYEADLFATLNLATFEDGAVVLVGRNVDMPTPVHILHVHTPGAERPYVDSLRHVVVAAEGSRLQLVEEHLGLGQGAYLNNVYTDVHVGPNAQVHHVKVQRDSLEAFHVGRNAVSLQRDCQYKSVTVTLGARLSRHDAYTLYQGENIDSTLDGLAYVRGQQVADTHTAIDHALPHSRSFQVHKCVVDDSAHTVFNGKIFVREGAQQISSKQLNQNLILSSRGHVDTKPQLEILAHDVVCTHGATVGQLEEEQYFYLLSRGLEPSSARSLLTYAFAAEVIEAIAVDEVRLRLEALLLAMASQGREPLLHGAKSEAGHGQ